MDRIDLEVWSQRLRKLFSHDDRLDVHDDPAVYFDGVFCEGLPGTRAYRPLWFEVGLVLTFEGQGQTFCPETSSWKHSEQEWRMFWLDEKGLFAEVSHQNAHLTEFFFVDSPMCLSHFIRLLTKDANQNQSKTENVKVTSMIESVHVPFFRHLDDLRLPEDLTVETVGPDKPLGQDPRELPWVRIESVSHLLEQHLTGR